MKRLLQFGFVVGLVATLAAGYFLPWIDYERYPSATTAVINGGRAETFVIRLPNDRIQAAGNTAQTLAAGPHGSPLRRPWPAGAGLDGVAASAVEHYKLRDAGGNVIGIAARHSTMTPTGAQAAWLLTFPSRGNVVFGGSESGVDSVENALAAAGWTPGSPLSREFKVPRLAGLASVAGTREFADIRFALDETWTVTGVDGDGQLHGTIELVTVGRKGG